MRPTALLTSLLLTLLTTNTPFLSVLAAPAAVPAPNDVLVPKGATLNARSIPELLALKRANERRRLNGKEVEVEMDMAGRV